MPFGQFTDSQYIDLGDFFSGLIQTGEQLGEQEIQQKITAHFGGDHIAAQNQAVQEMGRILDRFHQAFTKDYPTVENEIQAIADRFSSYAKTFNTARATRGATDVQNLARQLINDLEQERLGYRSPGGTPGSVLAGLPSWALPVGILAGLWLLTRTRRR